MACLYLSYLGIRTFGFQLLSWEVELVICEFPSNLYVRCACGAQRLMSMYLLTQMSSLMAAGSPCELQVLCLAILANHIGLRTL